jgi:hypothetical protein
MVGCAVVDDITSEAELPGSVAIFNLGWVEDIIRRRQTDPRNRSRAIKRAGPYHAVAPSKSLSARNWHKRLPQRSLKAYRCLFDLAGFGLGPSGQKADLLSLLRWQALEKRKQLFKGVGLRNAVSVKDPDPVEACQSVGTTIEPRRPFQVFLIANSRTLSGTLCQSAIGRRVVDVRSRQSVGFDAKPVEQLSITAASFIVHMEDAHYRSDSVPLCSG